MDTPPCPPTYELHPREQLRGGQCPGIQVDPLHLLHLLRGPNTRCGAKASGPLRVKQPGPGQRKVHTNSILPLLGEVCSIPGACRQPWAGGSARQALWRPECLSECRAMLLPAQLSWVAGWRALRTGPRQPSSLTAWHLSVPCPQARMRFCFQVSRQSGRWGHVSRNNSSFCSLQVRTSSFLQPLPWLPLSLYAQVRGLGDGGAHAQKAPTGAHPVGWSGVQTVRVLPSPPPGLRGAHRWPHCAPRHTTHFLSRPPSCPVGTDSAASLVRLPVSQWARFFPASAHRERSAASYLPGGSQVCPAVLGARRVTTQCVLTHPPPLGPVPSTLIEGLVGSLGIIPSAPLPV